jgi:hypothetical protein
MKQENTTHFESWLAAYESHLIELKQGKCPVPQNSAAKPEPDSVSESKSEAPPQKRP